MGLQDVRDLVSDLPRSLGDQIIGYAESVERSLPGIFDEAGRRQTPKLSRQVVFIAGLKKLHWLAASSYWTLDNSGRLLQSMDVHSIRIGRADVSRGSDIYQELKELVDTLERTLRDKQVMGYLMMSWPDLVNELATDGRR